MNDFFVLVKYKRSGLYYYAGHYSQGTPVMVEDFNKAALFQTERQANKANSSLGGICKVEEHGF